jgi:flagellar hook assembly protein FlgD
LAPGVPNPFSESTSFDLVLDHESNVAVDIFDVAGRNVRHMDIAHAAAGRTTISFDGRDHRGHSLPSGQYFYRVTLDGTRLTRKMLILR